MREAARDFLIRMGFDAHQALLVAHNDTAHKHVHIILNTIHPETGMTLDRNWSKNRAAPVARRIRAPARKNLHQSLRHDGPEPNSTTANGRPGRISSKEGRIDPEHAAALKSAEWRTLKDNQKRRTAAILQRERAGAPRAPPRHPRRSQSGIRARMEGLHPAPRRTEEPGARLRPGDPPRAPPLPASRPAARRRSRAPDQANAGAPTTSACATNSPRSAPTSTPA